MKRTNRNFIPDIKNPSPDYYCTWQTQLYATADGKPQAQRAILGEHALFDCKKPFGWAYFHEKARKDLFFVMDDSWDVPFSGDSAFYGSLILNEEKFPMAVSSGKNNSQALRNLSDRICALGWKGLGGWIHAGESAVFKKELSSEAYWQKRLEDAKEGGIAYWKVDWGKRANDINFRRMLTSLGKKIAPALVIEHAVRKETVTFADVYRTYDVPAIMSIPITMEKIADFADIPNDSFHALLNCEDEVYLAAAGGFTMGVMRHPYEGAFVNGKTDISFPPLHRNIKTKMYEVIRAAHWHRIAPAFCGSMTVSSSALHDTWRFLNPNEEMEAWWFDMPMAQSCIRDSIFAQTAPSAIARNCDLPEILPDSNGMIPYVVVSENPCGAFSVATLGRTMEREYVFPRCDVSVRVGMAATVGVFGEYRNLILKTERKEKPTVFMQDLAADFAYDITGRIHFSNGIITIPGDLISKIGTSEQPMDDTSEPGVLIALR